MSRITESLYNRYGINERKPLREDRRRNKKFLKEGKFDSLTESYIDLDDHKDELLEILISNGIDQQKAMQIVNEFGFINIKNLSDLSEYFNNEPTPGFYDAYRMGKSSNDSSPVPPYKATMVITDSVPIPHNILKNILKNEGWFSYNNNGNTYFKNKDEFEFYYYLIYEEN